MYMCLEKGCKNSYQNVNKTYHDEYVLVCSLSSSFPPPVRSELAPMRRSCECTHSHALPHSPLPAPGGSVMLSLLWQLRSLQRQCRRGVGVVSWLGPQSVSSWCHRSLALRSLAEKFVSPPLLFALGRHSTSTLTNGITLAAGGLCSFTRDPGGALSPHLAEPFLPDEANVGCPYVARPG